MKRTLMTQKLLALTLLSIAASGCLGKDENTGGGGGNTTVACKDQYENCVEITGAGSQSCADGSVSMGSSCGALKDSALSSCTTATNGVSSVTYYQPAFYLHLKTLYSLSCAQVKTSFETGCSGASGGFADLGGRHSAYNCN